MDKSARTIDGMRVRAVDPSRRAVGFGGSGQKQAIQVRKVQAGTTQRRLQKSQVESIRQQNPRQSYNEFGLSQKNVEKARLKASSDFLKPVSTLQFDLNSKDLKPDYSLKKRDLAEAPTRRGRKSSHNKTHKSHKLRNFAIAILILITVGGAGFAIWGNSLIAKLTNGQSGIFELISAIGSNVKLKTDESGRTNVLIFGTSGFDMEGTTIEGETHDGAQLTDSIMLLSVDQETKDVAMVSLPRDLYVGNTCTATGKVNEVYFCSNLYGEDEESGALALQKTLEDIFDIQIQYWVHVDWSALIEIVDGVGGITVTLDEDIEDEWTGTFIKAGEPAELDGWHAVALARARHGTEMGDFTRGNSQQKILAALQAKVVNDGIDLGTALKLVDIVGDDVRMNFNLEEIKSIFYLAKDIAFENIRQVPLIDFDKNIFYLTTADMNGISYVVPAAGARNYSDIQSYVHKNISSNPAVREDANILVLNGSGISGLAMIEQTKLNKAGFSYVEIDDAPEGTYAEPRYLYDITGAKPQSIASLKERYSIEALPREQLPDGINVDGVDIVIILGGE